MRARPRVLVLTYTTFVREPRALKQVRYLRDENDVTTAGFGPAPFPDIPHVEIPEGAPQRGGLLGRLLYFGLLAVRLFRPISGLSARDRDAVRLLGGQDWDVVIAHDVQAVFAANRLAPRFGVIVDLHEYAPRQNEHSLAWRLLIAPYFRWICRTVVAKAAAVVTVSQGIVDEYRREFGFESVLVVNATPYHALPVRPTGAPIRLVHSGIAAVQRRLEIMIEGVRMSSADVTLDLYLVDNSGFLEKLRAAAEGEPRVRFRDPVPYSELIARLNEYDVGLSILPPTTFNLAWCLPNKFFDFVQARLGVIVGPSPEMARFVDEYGIGEVLPDFDAASLAAALDRLDAATVDGWKASAENSADGLSSERQMEIWRDLIARVTS